MLKKALILVILCCSFTFAQSGDDYTILVVNDDGYDTPGIRALARALSDLGTVTVVGPLHNASGVGHGITYKTAIPFGRAENESGIPVYWVDAKPASCTRWALDTLFSENKPDLVVSGINRGVNTGNGVYYSGTVAAAREATFVGASAIAFSMRMGGATDWDGAAEYARDLCKKMLSRNEFFFLNVNFPSIPITKDVPAVFMPLTNERWPQTYEVRTNPRDNSTYFWIVNSGSKSPEPGTDQGAVVAGNISITPLKVDLTDYKKLEELQRQTTTEEKKEELTPFWK